VSQVETVITDVKSEEGWRGFLYDDKTGKNLVQGSVIQGFGTAGWGFCLDAERGRPIPRPVGDFWLKYLVTDLERELLQWPQFPRLKPGYQRALLQMAYQMGTEPFDGDGYRDWKNMLAAMVRGDNAAAARHALDTKWHRVQTPARARRVAQLILEAA
jgi:hypothetical protein